MIPAITLQELLDWDCQSSDFWRAHLDANPALLELPCGIGGTATVQAFVRHIWGAELIWSQRIAGLPGKDKDHWRAGPLDALFDMHLEAVRNFRALLDDPAKDWATPMHLNYPWLRPEARKPSPRKLLAHVLFHSQRHWAQLSTLVRSAGFPSEFLGDLLFSSGLE